MFPVAPSNLHLLDFVLMAILLAGLPLWDYFVDTPRSRRRLEAGTYNPIHTYVRTCVTLWALVLLLAVDWWIADRDPKILGFAVHLDLRFMVGCFFIIAVMALFSWEYFRILRLSDERRHKIMEKIVRIFVFAPSNSRQLLYFVGVSITAGVTEELLCRGFLIWSLTAYMNVVIAAILSSIFFGLGHSYQGASGIVKTGGVGLIMASLYIGSGTILLPMILHAFVDAHNGFLAYSLKSSLTASTTSLPTDQT